ncbi:MAG TPA: HtaA domain-containing protein [Solirubrobacterales bacterium]|nr:HtaA domain-containing protein [Solirubrobacterales bacterium]
MGPALGGGRQLVLPPAGGLAGSKVTVLRFRGGLALAASGPSVREGATNGRAATNRRARAVLTDLTLRVMGRRGVLEARLSGDELPLFEVLAGGHREVDAAAGSVRLRNLPLRLSPLAAKTLAGRLGLSKALPARRIGALSASLTGLASGDDGGAPGGTGAAPGSSPAPGGGGGAQKSAACPLPAGAGPAGEGTPPVAARPAGAVDVTGASLQWHVRESFIRYIASGEGTSAVEGATADPPVLLPGASAPLSYDFRFPFASGWLDTGADAGSPADDRAALYFNGGLRFRYSAHGIDLLAASPELELAGGGSRAIFAVADNGGAAQRQVLVNLDLGRAGGISQSSNTYTYERVPAAIPSGTASSTFAGFYAPGTDFGCFTVSFSTGS